MAKKRGPKDQRKEVKKLSDAYAQFTRNLKDQEKTVKQIDSTWKAYLSHIGDSEEKLKEYINTTDKSEKAVAKLLSKLLQMGSLAQKNIFEKPSQGLKVFIDQMTLMGKAGIEFKKIEESFKHIISQTTRSGKNFNSMIEKFNKVGMETKKATKAVDSFSSSLEKAGVSSRSFSKDGLEQLKIAKELSKTWNEFQSRTKGLFPSRKEASKAYKAKTPPSPPSTIPSIPSPLLSGPPPTPTPSDFPFGTIDPDWFQKKRFKEMKGAEAAKEAATVMGKVSYRSPPLPPSPTFPLTPPPPSVMFPRVSPRIKAMAKQFATMSGPTGSFASPPLRKSMTKSAKDPTHPQHKQWLERYPQTPSFDWGADIPGKPKGSKYGAAMLQKSFAGAWEPKEDYGDKPEFLKTLTQASGSGSAIELSNRAGRIARRVERSETAKKELGAFGKGIAKSGDLGGMFQNITKINPKAIKGMGKMFKGLAKSGGGMAMAGTGIGLVIMVIMKLLEALDPFKLIIEAVSTIFGAWGAILQTAFLPIVTLLFEEAFSEENMELINMLKDSFAQLAEALIPVFSAVFPLIGLLIQITIALMPLVIQLLPMLTASLTYMQIPLQLLLIATQLLVPVLGVLMGVFNIFVVSITAGYQIIADKISRFRTNAIDPFANGMKSAANFIINVINKVIAGVNALDVGDAFSDIPQIPLLAKQGIVQRSGIAKVHTGEVVVRKELIKEIFQEQMNVTNNFYGNTDGMQQLEYEQSMVAIYNHRRRK